MKEFVESLIPLERTLFFAINGSDSLLLDNLMWTISGRYVWIPLYLFIFFLFFYKKPTKEAILLSVFFILVFVAADQISSSFFKPFFERYRPTHHPDFKDTVDIVNGYRGGRYGFISGHATNSFGLAVFLSLAGMLIGTLVAFIMYWLFMMTRKAIIHPPSSQRVCVFERKDGTLLATTIISYLILLTIFSPFLATLPH